MEMETTGNIIISAIISTYNREKYIPAVLNSLLRQTLHKDAFEIIIVDNNCTDNTPVICREFINNHPELKISYILERNQGLSFARNCGIRNSNGELLTFVDDDAYLADNFLEVCVSWFQSHPDVEAIGGKILLHYEGIRPDWVTKYHESLFGYFDPGDEEKIFSGGKYPRGSNMTFRKRVFDVHGMFNTNLGRTGSILLGSEEKELFSRMDMKREKVTYVPGAIVYHLVSVERTTKDFVKKQAIGIGKSEQIRTKANGIYLKRIIQEIIKWGGTILLFVFFLFNFNLKKAKMIVFLRYYISKGLLKT